MSVRTSVSRPSLSTPPGPPWPRSRAALPVPLAPSRRVPARAHASARLRTTVVRDLVPVETRRRDERDNRRAGAESERQRRRRAGGGRAKQKGNNKKRYMGEQQGNGRERCGGWRGVRDLRNPICTANYNADKYIRIQGK